MLLEQLVVGSCVSALLKSYVEGIPIVVENHDIDELGTALQHPLTVEQVTTSNSSELCSVLKFILAMRGLVVNPHSVDFLRLEEDKLHSRNLDIQFGKCHLFPTQNLKSDLEVRKVQDEGIFEVMDFMKVRTGSVIDKVTIYPSNSFIDSIGLLDTKSIVAISRLSKEQLTNFDYSDTIVRFLCQKELSESKHINRPIIRKESSARRHLKLEVVSREVTCLEEVVFKSTKKVKYYDRKKRNDIIEAYRRHSSGI